MRERDDHPLPGTHERGELLFCLGEPACGHRRPLSVERRSLAARERVEQGRGAVRHRVEPLLRPDAFDRLRLEDDVGVAVERRHEIAGELGQLLVVAQLGLDEIEPPLRRRVDDRVVDRPERALGERRERPHGLDLVAEQLDAERVAARGREDIDDPAADGELPALLDALDPLVAGERQMLGNPVDARLRADPQLQPLRPVLVRRHRLGEGGGRGADEPARG